MELTNGEAILADAPGTETGRYSRKEKVNLSVLIKRSFKNLLYIIPVMLMVMCSRSWFCCDSSVECRPLPCLYGRPSSLSFARVPAHSALPDRRAHHHFCPAMQLSSDSQRPPQPTAALYVYSYICWLRKLGDKRRREKVLLAVSCRP